MKDVDAVLELPMEEDENIGDGAPKKRLKRKKTKEERAAERKVIFWTFFIIFGTTIFFWLWPKLEGIKFGLPSFSSPKQDSGNPKNEWKNYVEYKL